MKLVALVLLQFSFLAGASALAAGATCTDTASCADANLVCESTVCKIKVGVACTISADKCVTEAKCQLATGVTSGDAGVCKIKIAGACTISADKCVTEAKCQWATGVTSGDAGVCRKLIGQTCSSTTECVTAATCSTGTSPVCTCPTGQTESTDKITCRKLIGETCSSTTECVTVATCSTGTTPVCTCPSGQTASTDKKTCSGAASVIASLALLLASVVTSRYL